MDTTTPQKRRTGRVPKDLNCPKNAAARAYYQRKMARLRETPDAYREHLERKADYQKAYRQTDHGYAVVKAAEERWQAAHPGYSREYYQSTIRPQVVDKIEEIVSVFDRIEEDDRLELVRTLCDASHCGDYITMFAMQWTIVADRITPYLVELGEAGE